MENASRQGKTRNVRQWLCGMTVVLGLTSTMAVAQRAPRAVPVEDPPAPVRAVPVEDPAPVRAQPVTDPNRPSGPDEDLYDYATLAFTQQDYNIALKPFADYVRLYPTGRHAPEAWFRLAECYHKTGQRTEAIRAYNEVMVRHGKTESASSAAYRLGMYSYQAREFLKAASWFEITENVSSSPDIRGAATFNKALSFKYAGQPAKALASFKIIAASKSPNLQKEAETAQQEIATLAIEAGNIEDAAAALKQVIATSKDNAVLGDARLKYGLVLNTLGKAKEALEQFEKVLEIPGLPEDKKSAAVFGLIQSSFVSGDYDAAIASYTGNTSVVLPDDLRPKQLLIVGSAYERKQNYRAAIGIFLNLEKDHPDSPEALEAGYLKLKCFAKLNDKDLPLFAERFEERYAVKYPKHEYLQMSRLIRADALFSAKEYAKAAEAFTGVDLKLVPEKVRGSVLYQKGFAEAEAGKSNDAINTLTLFLTEHPKDPNAAVALAQRGVSYRAVGALDKALADFVTIVKEHENAGPAVEMALYQCGKIRQQTRDLKGMVEDFEMLVKKFPESGAAAEANYLIGRGYLDLRDRNQMTKGLEPLRKAISLNREEYLDKASQVLIALQAAREDLDGLAKEVDAYLEARKDAAISPTTLLTLGRRYFERGNYRASARYLAKASTPDEPKSTEAPVWNFLGRAELENGNYEAAIKALDNYIAQTPDGGGWAEALLHKATAYLRLGNFKEAQAFSSEALQKVKEGRLKAKLQILQGDIANAHGDSLAASGDKPNATAEWKKAAGSYIVISQFMVDPEITPEAAYKAIQVLDKIGEKEKAEALRAELKLKYPNYRPKEAAKEQAGS